MREKHISFIEKDLKERGETQTSKIRFLGMIYSLRVKKEGDTRAKTVTYSAAQNVLSGYRTIMEG